MSINKTRLDESNGSPLPLSPDEMILFKQGNVQLQLDTGTGYPATTINYLIPSGVLYLTTHRIIFIQKYGSFRSFECGVHALHEGHSKEPSHPLLALISESPSFTAKLEIIPGAGLFSPATCRFFFKDGGLHTFADLLRQRSEIQVLLQTADEEELPAYTEARPSSSFSSPQ